MMLLLIKPQFTGLPMYIFFSLFLHQESFKSYLTDNGLVAEGELED